MSVIELRKKIMERVSSIENEEILKEIYDIIGAEANLEPVYKLTDEERSAIEIGLKDLREGRVVSSTKANDLIQEWLKK
jgi:dihydroxyacetone kinase DhaKLM complex PTS-EIIA-like component DhaM